MSDGSYQGYRAQCEARELNAFLLALLACLTNDSFDRNDQQSLWKNYDDAAERADVKDHRNLTSLLQDGNEKAWLSVLEMCREFWNRNLYKAFHGISPFSRHTVITVSASEDGVYVEPKQIENLAKEIVRIGISEEELRGGRGEYALLLPLLDPRTVRIIRKK